MNENVDFASKGIRMDVYVKDGNAVYDLKVQCTEEKKIRLNDRAFKILFNADFYDKMKSKDQQAFFYFLKSGKAGG